MALSDKEILEVINKDTGKPPTWADTYNRWFANEYLPWINGVQGSNVKVSDLAISKDGTIIPNASVPLWNWNTGGDTAAQKAALDQRYIASLDAYNKEKGTNIQPDKAVLGANVQPNSTYRAADSGSWWTDLRDTVEAAGVVAGNYFLPGSSLLTSRLVSEGAQEQLATDEFRLANLAAGVGGGMEGNMANYGKVGESLGMTSADPNAVGGVTGPDNIDVGGGWSPATGATAAELEAARFALENPTIDQITADISGGNIDLGGGISINPDGSINGGTFTGSGDSFLGEAGGLGSTLNTSQITNDIAGDNIDAGGGWSPATGATEAELAKARAAMAATGWTMSQALDAIRAGLLINAVTGDPLNLGGGQPEQSPAGPVGFEMVPIPAEWKSPTYAASSAPIDLSTIFSNQNMLGGTQWQGLPSQRNVSFNDIFAAGQQQTPMGTPVDINQIVSAILGQAATSQKSA